MKTLNESFTDQEWQALIDVKEFSGLSWHNFLLIVASWYLEMPVNWQPTASYQRLFLALREEVKTE
jgi:hypothetical protein